MAALAGLTGMYGALDNAPAGTVDEGAYQVLDQAGNSAELHSKPGDTSGQVYPAGWGLGYSGQSTYVDQNGQLVEFATDAGLPTQGVTIPGEGALDHTPSSHGGAWPVGNPEEYTTLDPRSGDMTGRQMRLLHGTERGGSEVFAWDAPGGHEALVDLPTERYAAPNENGLAKLSGAQRAVSAGPASGGGGHLGTADVDQGYGELNDNPEFQGGHSIRYVQHDRMPWDYTGLGLPNEGMWLGKHPVGTATSFDGVDSPYGVSGGTHSDQLRPEIRGYPSEFPVSPAPTVVPTPVAVDVFASDGL